ncbi:MAG: STAS domain-containing protein [Acidobacteriota bacterium]|nr:STAS domain-containing protein [Acidobacteriota bacterium]
MRSEIEQHDGAVIVKIKGRIDIGEGDVELRNTLQGVKRAGARHILLDMSKVTHMDSSGIGELISQYSDLRSSGVDLILTCLKPKIYDLMTVTRLITVFPIYDSNEDAMQTLLQAA